jgi:hypothetical protein
LEKENSLEPGSEQLYFPLREDAEAAVLRGIRWTDASTKDLVLIQLVFKAVGVATLWPDVLYNQPDGAIDSMALCTKNSEARMVFLCTVF